MTSAVHCTSLERGAQRLAVASIDELTTLAWESSAPPSNLFFDFFCVPQAPCFERVPPLYCVEVLADIEARYARHERESGSETRSASRHIHRAGAIGYYIIRAPSQKYFSIFDAPQTTAIISESTNIESRYTRRKWAIMSEARSASWHLHWACVIGDYITHTPPRKHFRIFDVPRTTTETVEGNNAAVYVEAIGEDTAEYKKATSLYEDTAGRCPGILPQHVREHCLPPQPVDEAATLLLAVGMAFTRLYCHLRIPPFTNTSKPLAGEPVVIYCASSSVGLYAVLQLMKLPGMLSAS
ncbi:hypothetical protein PLICRDRAFT_180670 [Plicaturopsis crispa FD-325 SS-3]|uniref:Enoyl reductase (ER) domain-containing protein n=1 Tax=Plicaturopsis crispa FD-325 SS-3 TaxID=944288 RepID=A0A0C9SVQ7_PLICR|nr:hypothetical protein PLICRDRAFT_180670 [Plicaturopsis crispa FD-325 SS-3]